MSNNGNGNSSDGFGDEGDTTPNERPTATLEAHRPYVFALTNVCSELSKANQSLAAMLHDIRIAREPIGKKIRDGVSKVLGNLSETFKGASEEFSK